VRHEFPILLDVSDRLIVIVGGGSVAVRKARGLIEAGATRVRVIAPEFDPAMPADVERVVAMYECRHLEGAGLVFAATNVPAVNERVALDSHQRGILVCRADWVDDGPADRRGAGGDFVTPARLSRGALQIFVAAGSSALSAAVRDRLADRLDPAWIALADAMTELRPMILRSGMAPARRRQALRELAGAEAMETIARSGREGLRRWLGERFTELNNVLGDDHG
jgi:precorrin-2 dehydrogenase/sirohydrochlorin ferrochelatase